MKIQRTTCQPLILLLSLCSEWMAITAPTLVAAFSRPITVVLATRQVDNSHNGALEDAGVRPLTEVRLAAANAGHGLLEGTTPAQNQSERKRPYKHIMAILSVPSTSIDRIANEAILETALSKSDKLSVVLRCEGTRKSQSLVSLRGYVGEIYSQLWDLVMEEFPRRGVPDVVVYPQNMPNTAPESWIDIQPDLDCVCTHDTLVGWVSEEATGRGVQFLNNQGSGRGGLKEHVAALNAERLRRKLDPVTALPPEHWPIGAQVRTAQDDMVVFLDDEPNTKSAIQQALELDYSPTSSNNGDSTNGDYRDFGDNGDAELSSSSFLSGAPISSHNLFESVAVGGTFDGLHFGHRKLLTLAVSSVQPMTGRLLVGITQDEMLRNKKCADQIPNYKTRAAAVQDFLKRLAPGCLK